MLRTLLTTTAIVAVMQTGAFAQEKSLGDAMTPAPIFQEDGQYKPSVNEQGYFETAPGQILASSLIGMSVYHNSTDEAEAIGDINDVIISKQGNAEAVIIGVGGFLGIGEKDVAIGFDRVNWVEKDGDRMVVVDATKEELDAAPAYDRVAMENDATEDNKPMTTAESEKPADDMQKQQMAENAGSMDREKMTSVELSAITAEELEGATVYGQNQEDVGEVGEVVVGDAGQVDTIIVDVGGFLGIGEKHVAIGTENIDFRKMEDGELVVFTPFTEEQLEQQAAYSADKKNENVMKAPRS